MNKNKLDQELKTSTRKCPICENKSGQQLLSFDIDDFDGTSFSGQVKLMSCKNCGFVFNDSDDGSNAYDSYYENESFYFTDTSFGTGGTTEFDRNRYSLYFKILEQHKLDNNMFIVDIGCGKGGLLSFLSEKGFNKLAGVDIDQRLVNIAQEFGLNVKKGSATNLPNFDEKVDMFCLSHVLEHLYDLEDAIKMMKSQLKDNGIVFIEVPDASRYSDGRVFDFFWLAMREHVNHFDPWHLEMLMSKHGFKKEYMLQSLVSYDGNYVYPSLIMLFRKTNDVLSDFVFGSDLVESIKNHISKENVNLNRKKRIIEELISNQKEVCIWGIASEFFILYSLTDLRRCNIKCIIDKNPMKQTKKVDGIKINPPEFLINLSHDTTVLITSVFRKREMLKYLKEICFGGETIVMETHNILHITPHLGGGVGRVLLNYLSKVKGEHSLVHKVACLDYANENAMEVAKNVGFTLLDSMSDKKQELLDTIAEADIVFIHWWNHPLLYDFLVREQLPPCRVIMWSHNSGFHPPGVFTDKVLAYPDLFVFTTPMSYKTKEIQNLTYEQKKFLRVVWSTGGVEHVKSVKPKTHTGFNIGYIGTVDYAKMHPDFLNICNQVDIPNVNFIVCSGPKEKELRQEAEHLGIGEKFNITGPVPDIKEYLSLFDVFGYPLAPYHYGTCDQTLQESMAAGVVPVVLANPMESYMVKDGVTGIVAKDKDEYIKALQDLYHNHELRNKLSQNAREYAIHTFSLEKMANEWKNIFNEMLDFPKTVRNWKNSKTGEDISAKDVFLESLGHQGEDFVSYCNAESDDEKKSAIEKIKKLAESANWQAETRGTIHHYNSFFPNEHYLSVWSQLMRERKSL